MGNAAVSVSMGNILVTIYRVLSYRSNRFDLSRYSSFKAFDGSFGGVLSVGIEVL